MSLIRYPELYQVGVAVAAVSQWNKLIRYERSFDRDFAYSYWKEILSRSADEEYAQRISPFYRIDEFSRPVKIIHGAADHTVPVNQAILMEKAFKKAGKEVELVIFPDVGHFMGGRNTVIRYLEEIEVFINQHLLN